MNFVIQDLIGRSRMYVDDDHEAESATLKPERWLALFNTEYAVLYRKWMRMGLIRVAPVDTAMADQTLALAGVLAIVGVAQDTGSRLRVLPALDVNSPIAGWRPSQEANGTAQGYTVTGFGNDVTVELHPHDNQFAQYVVRYVVAPPPMTAITDVVSLPYGADERLVLGMAKRAYVKDREVSRVLEDLIQQADADLAFEAAAAIPGGPRVRRLARTPTSHHSRFGDVFPADPGSWFYPA